MELRHLRYFVAVAEELNIRRAAERLNISHPPLSRQLHDLELEAGVALITRGKRGIALTDAGRVFLGEARLILAHAAEAVRDAREAHRGTVGRLRIAYTFGHFEASLAAVLKAFRARYPRVQIEIQQLDPQDQMLALQRNTIDIAYAGLRFPALQAQLHFECIRLAAVHTALPQGHRLLTEAALPLAALAAENFVSLGGVYYDYQAWLERLCANAGFKPRIVHTADSGSTLFGLIAAGFGLALLPALHDRPASEVEFRPMSDDLPKFQFHVAWRQDSEAPALSNYIALMREYVRAAP